MSSSINAFDDFDRTVRAVGPLLSTAFGDNHHHHHHHQYQHNNNNNNNNNNGGNVFSFDLLNNMFGGSPPQSSSVTIGDSNPNSPFMMMSFPSPSHVRFPSGAGELHDEVAKPLSAHSQEVKVMPQQHYNLSSNTTSISHQDQDQDQRAVQQLAAELQRAGELPGEEEEEEEDQQQQDQQQQQQDQDDEETVDEVEEVIDEEEKTVVVAAAAEAESAGGPRRSSRRPHPNVKYNDDQTAYIDHLEDMTDDEEQEVQSAAVVNRAAAANDVDNGHVINDDDDDDDDDEDADIDLEEEEDDDDDEYSEDVHHYHHHHYRRRRANAKKSTKRGVSKAKDRKRTVSKKGGANGGAESKKKKSEQEEQEMYELHNVRTLFHSDATKNCRLKFLFKKPGANPKAEIDAAMKRILANEIHPDSIWQYHVVQFKSSQYFKGLDEIYQNAASVEFKKVRDKRRKQTKRNVIQYDRDDSMVL